MKQRSALVTSLRSTVAAAALCALATAAAAQQMPAYYPKEGFSRTGEVDAVFFEEQRIVIDDITYQLSDNVVVHSPRSYSVPRTRLRDGLNIGFKIIDGRQIIEIWLLPRDYRVRR